MHVKKTGRPHKMKKVANDNPFIDDDEDDDVEDLTCSSTDPPKKHGLVASKSARKKKADAPVSEARVIKRAKLIDSSVVAAEDLSNPFAPKKEPVVSDQSVELKLLKQELHLSKAQK